MVNRFRLLLPRPFLFFYHVSEIIYGKRAGCMRAEEREKITEGLGLGKGGRNETYVRGCFLYRRNNPGLTLIRWVKPTRQGRPML